ncbi:ECF transporter S component [Iamia sp.]|uniref:ECF transporter S component n=1 Tax=Iamia sp. TaxID=2722710 RepID=UPI002CBA7ABF|nr:ECF transporter S component [Iamia sp.]HXH58193.1 ECF transporter S component [Iamia sp.]
MTRTARVRIAYVLASVVGAGAFLYPFWLPAEAGIATAHAADAPFVAGLVGGLAVAAVMVEIRSGTMTGTDVALLGMLSAMAGLLRLLDLPGGGSGIFFLVLLGAAAFGPRFGFLLGLFGMALSAIITGGIGPWLPFQMLVLAWLAAATGAVGRLTRRLPARLEIAVLAAVAWVAGFAYGAIINVWSWPLLPGDGPLQWRPGLGLFATLEHYWSFYVATSLAWDAAGATANVVAVAVLGRPVLRSLRRFSHRLDPVVVLEPTPPPTDAVSGAPGATSATTAAR